MVMYIMIYAMCVKILQCVSPNCHDEIEDDQGIPHRNFEQEVANVLARDPRLTGAIPVIPVLAVRIIILSRRRPNFKVQVRLPLSNIFPPSRRRPCGSLAARSRERSSERSLERP